MKIESTTVYTKKRLLRFSDYNASSRTLFWCAVVLINLCVFFSVLHSALTFTVSSMDVFMTVYIVLMDILLPCLYFLLPRVTVKKAKNMNADVNYAFEDEGLSLNVKTEQISESSSVKYAALYKVAENKQDLYLYMARNKGFIVDISAFTAEQKASLKAALVNSLGEKKVKWK